MNANFMIIECQQGHRFKFGLLDDGYSKCPRCDTLLGKPYYAPREQVQQLTRIGQAWQEKSKAESNKPKQSIQIDVDMDTSKMQLKLRAIAKHAEALADELDAIDNGWQCECGSTEYTTTFEDNFLKDNECNGCGKNFSFPIDDELPTRLEGSE